MKGDEESAGHSRLKAEKVVVDANWVMIFSQSRCGMPFIFLPFKGLNRYQSSINN